MSTRRKTTKTPVDQDKINGYAFSISCDLLAIAQMDGLDEAAFALADRYEQETGRILSDAACLRAIRSL